SFAGTGTPAPEAASGASARPQAPPAGSFGNASDALLRLQPQADAHAHLPRSGLPRCVLLGGMPTTSPESDRARFAPTPSAAATKGPTSAYLADRSNPGHPGQLWRLSWPARPGSAPSNGVCRSTDPAAKNEAVTPRAAVGRLRARHWLFWLASGLPRHRPRRPPRGMPYARCHR